MSTQNTDLLAQLQQLNRTMKQLRQLKNSHLALIDANSGQGQVLALLTKAQRISQKNLVAQLKMQPQSASELIKKLEKKGYVQRTRSPEDGRAFDVSLTAAGTQAAQRLSGDEADHFDVLSGTDKEELARLLAKLNASFDEEYTTAKDNFGVNIFGAKK